MKQRKKTLVIAPTVAIVQWRNEFSKFTKGFKVDVWHGSSRASDVQQLENFDVILTSCENSPFGFEKDYRAHFV